MASEVSFEISYEDRCAVDLIIDRAADIAKDAGVRRYDKLSARMDLIATHANGCPLDLHRLSRADDFNVAHDVFGITRHLDRETGKLTSFFRPRFATN